jgi:hypothetical protein
MNDARYYHGFGLALMNPAQRWVRIDSLQLALLSHLVLLHLPSLASRKPGLTVLQVSCIRSAAFSDPSLVLAIPAIHTVGSLWAAGQ